MPPATAMWLCLDQDRIVQAEAVVEPPAAADGIFFSARRPGVVLRVQQMRARIPATRRTSSFVAVATPERWPSRLSATFASEDRTGGARDRHRGHFGDRRPVALMSGDLDCGRKFREGGGHHR